MDYIVLKETKRGKYYIIKALLRIKGRKKALKYNIKQKVETPNKLGVWWKLSRIQMKNILTNTDINDWLVKIPYEFNGLFDSFETVDNDFRPLTPRDLDKALNWLSGDLTIVSYRSDENVFNIYCRGVGEIRVKPKTEDLVQLILPPELKKELLVYLL